MHHKRFLNNQGLVQWVILLVVLVVGAVLALNLQALRDYARLRGYEPSATVAALADQTTMTDEARKLFYVNHPVLADRSHFSGQCTSRGEQTIVLGCYKPVDRGIFLFDVQDERLDGVEQVTAAHEMLHAAYDRLSGRERDAIDVQLQNFYNERIKNTDERLRGTIAAYEKSEPNDVSNEMHSIFATEVAELPDELESYYKRYFQDRSKVIAYADTYRSEFTARQEKVRLYDLQLMSIKDRINANKAELQERETDIRSTQQQLEEYRQQDDIETYNSLVPIYNARVEGYNQLVRTVQRDIATYNRLVTERNQVASQVKELTESISSAPQPIGQ
ncbi:MAG TPA: hypothetical protein VK978_04425 [Candidatus Saccharimonadales bacterium]|nr:hypothetical protein [Candidatus Saccharimonadales bacterium]